MAVSVLALAVSVWSAWNQHRSERRVQLQLLDTAAPALRVVGPEPRRERWAAPRHLGAGLGVIPPDTEYVLPRQAQDLVLIGADVLLVNEGTVSALVSFGGAHSVFNEGVGAFGSWFGPGENAVVPYRQGDGRFVLVAGAKCLLLLREGRSVEGWAATPNAPLRVELAATPAGGEAVEEAWVVELEGPVLTPVHEDASHWRAVPHTPVKARIERLARRYG